MGRFEPALKTETHLGIERQPRDRTAADLPITPPQAEVLAILSQEPQGVTAIARQCGRTTSSVASSCYALADRGLVVRQGRGWRLPDA
jgi:DNA-binding MarR family transcriptional regulator